MEKLNSDSEHVDEREKIIAETKDFIEKECTEIGELLAYMSWTPDGILKSDSVTQCPYDPSHQMPESSLKQHASACRLKKMGLSCEEVEVELQKDDIFYKNADLVGKVQLDEGLLNRILWNHTMENRQVRVGHRAMPVSANDWVVKLSPQERLAVYEHVVQSLKQEGKMANVERDEVLTTDWERIVKKGMLEHGGERPKTHFELLAMLRDQKRRRQSYRAKNVHITKKSYTEIIREVIQNQMEILMPSKEIKQEREEDSSHDREITHQSHRTDDSSHRNRSHSPKRRGNSSRSQSKRRDHSSRERHSPQRSRSRTRSRSPREKHRSGSRLRAEDEGSTSSRTQDTDGERKKSSEPLSHPDQDYEEGQIESDESSHRQRSHPKKKSSKHKKHKHKKHKSRSHRPDSD